MSISYRKGKDGEEEAFIGPGDQEDTGLSFFIEFLDHNGE